MPKDNGQTGQKQSQIIQDYAQSQGVENILVQMGKLVDLQLNLSYLLSQIMFQILN